MPRGEKLSLYTGRSENKWSCNGTAGLCRRSLTIIFCRILVLYKPIQTPKGHGVRVDDGFEQGMEIPIYYDPMIAKLITYGKDREEAIERMVRAIDEYEITGIQTTLGFGKFVMQHEAFTSGKFDTHFVDKYFNADSLKNDTMMKH